MKTLTAKLLAMAISFSAIFVVALNYCELKLVRFDPKEKFTDCHALEEINMGYVGKHAFCVSVTFQLGPIPYIFVARTVSESTPP